jgi:hypothetical protein
MAILEVVATTGGNPLHGMDGGAVAAVVKRVAID